MADLTSLDIIRFSRISGKRACKFALGNTFSGQYVSKMVFISPFGIISASVEALVRHARKSEGAP
jgi:hypothetical protein